MAKVIRNQWVWKKNNRWWTYLPRRQDGVPKPLWDDREIYGQIQNFKEPMQSEPPKLWVVWLFRDYDHLSQPQRIKDQIQNLFGDSAKPGEIQVFKNTPSTNVQLWKIKHLIEIRPMSFPQGEPKFDDVSHVEIMADGRCIIDKTFPNPEGIKLVDTTKQFEEKYLASYMKQRDLQGKDVYEDTVYNPHNISIID